MGDLIILVGYCDIFHGPVILHNISNTFLWIYIMFKLLVQYDAVSELTILIAVFCGLMMLRCAPLSFNSSCFRLNVYLSKYFVDRRKLFSGNNLNAKF